MKESIVSRREKNVDGVLLFFVSALCTWLSFFAIGRFSLVTVLFISHAYGGF